MQIDQGEEYLRTLSCELARLRREHFNNLTDIGKVVEEHKEQALKIKGVLER